MESNLKAWKSRNLTYEGKSLIIKTFGLSQLIYGMQVFHKSERWGAGPHTKVCGHVSPGGGLRPSLCLGIMIGN